MPDMPEWIAKGEMLTRFDDLTRKRSVRRALLGALERGDALVDIARAFRVIRTDVETVHFAHDWLGGWWLHHQPVEPILREGFRLALTKAQERKVAVDTYWICNGDLWECAVCVSRAQVTLLISTPPPPVSVAGTGTFTVPDPVWIVRGDAA
jgi:hypothetical protein